jgi:hypothetical protein
MTGLIVGTVCGLLAIVLVYFTLRRGKAKVGRAREHSRVNEFQLLKEARNVAPKLWSPEEIRQRERVTEAFGGGLVVPKRQPNRSPDSDPERSLASFVELPTSEANWLSEPDATPLVSEELLFGGEEQDSGDKVQRVAKEISTRLNSLAAKVELIAGGVGNVNERSDKIMLTVAKEWNLLPLSDLD